MAKKDKVSLPAGTAGLVRYFDDYKETFQIKPETVVISTIAIIIIMVFLRVYAVL